MTFRRPIICAVLLASCGGGTPSPTRLELPPDPAAPTTEDGVLDDRIGPAESAHPDQSGFRLLDDGSEAFAVRVQSARAATRSLDVQTYIWHGDLTGAYLGQALLEAADRGVRVRLLVDDLDARAKNEGFAALAAHPQIEVRMFNPWLTRSGALARAGEAILHFGRINRRMHNKSWIADDRVAVVGGRNVGDEYFNAAEQVNFLDLDLAMLGPVVREAASSFDRYWSSGAAHRMEALDADNVTESGLGKLRERLARHAAEAAGSRYARALEGSDRVKRMIEGDWPLHWSSGSRFVSDDPAKVTMKERDAARTQVGAALGPMLQAARERVTIVSPYFVPGEEVAAGLARMAASGKTVRVLTNSLVANDVAAVHGAYSRYRETLLRGGVELWELKPAAGAGKTSLPGSSGASLHTKAFAVDGSTLFVGSYNFDPRSTWLNCEQGVLVEDPALAGQLETLFEGHVDGAHAWRVTLVDGGLLWSDGQEFHERDPGASAWQRFQAWATRVLSLDAQL